jgi:hypothetical protein
VVLMEFPSMTATLNWYKSLDYQRILPLQADNAISDLILVEGVRPDFTVAGFARKIRAAIGAGTGAGG